MMLLILLLTLASTLHIHAGAALAVVVVLRITDLVRCTPGHRASQGFCSAVFYFCFWNLSQGHILGGSAQGLPA